MPEPHAPLPTTSSPPPAADHVDFRDGTFHGPVVGVQHHTTYTSADGGFGLADPASRPVAAEADPVAFGVRPVRRPGVHDPLPPYVRRDLDAVLSGWRERHGLLVVTGGPLTGKSRTAWAALLRDTPPGTRVYAPAPGTDLRPLPSLLRGRPGHYALWLDELEGYLGDHGLTAGLLAELTALDVPVVATMTDDVYDEHRFGSGAAPRLLSRARTEAVSSRWSAAELAGLTAAGSPLLDEALARRGTTGVTQYLALGTELAELLLRARLSTSRHPYGRLLVRAAVELTLCGVTGGLRRSLLEQAARRYPAGRAASHRESFESAIAWATELRHGLTGLLVASPRPDHTVWRPYGSLVADAERYGPLTRVDREIWRAALDGTKDSADAHEAVRATGRAAFEASAEAGDPEALRLMALLAEHPSEQLSWYRRAADAGITELAARVGELLLAEGKPEEALPYLRTAAEQPDAAPATARLLGRAHLALAETWLRRGEQGGDLEAAQRLGDLMLGRGDLRAAGNSYSTAESHGYPPAARGRGMHLLLWGEPAEAEMYLARAADAGDPIAATLRKNLRSEDARGPRELETSLEDTMMESVYPWDHTHLGHLREKQGRFDDARAAYEEGHAAGDPYAAHRLARLLHRHGCTEEAAEWSRKAAAGGYPGTATAAAPPATPPPDQEAPPPPTPAPDTVRE
ncbi:tetratricopeptide repeat protein [Streptomyces sp. NPDC086091]|uniref:tetratricopeptide repeat protein n=1 Tax=Streptomyces sp. NPDC086091 TaxID=3365751 RepID=UPI00380FDE0F